MKTKTLIEHATVLDGSGQPPFHADIRLQNDRIESVGVCSEPREAFDRIIDARGMYAAPGFIDVHTHTDLANFLPRGLQPKIMQGVTTEVIGQCGLGVAPMPHDRQAGWRKQLIIGNPPVPWAWETTAEYLSALQTHGLESNLVPFVGHGVLRYAVRADRAGALSAQEIRQTQAFAEEAFEAGVFGASFGLIYVPAIFAEQRELQAILEVVSHYQGIAAVHLRSESDELLEAIREMFQLSETCHCRLHLSHLKVIGERNRQKIETVFHWLENQRLTFDCYPYRAGSTTLLAIFPPFVVEGSGLEETLDRLRDPAMRQRIKRIFRGEETPAPGTAWDNLPNLVGWKNIFIADLPDNVSQAPIGQSLYALAEQRCAEPADVAMDLMLAAHGAVRMIDYYEDEATLEKILTHPLGMLGTDTLLGGKAHPRVFGTYPRFLHEYVFQRQLLSLETAIAKMTAKPAAMLGLTGRGLLRPGAVADLVIFDRDFRDRATFEQPARFPNGLRYVLINGHVKVDNGNYCDTRPGKLLTRSREVAQKNPSQTTSGK